MEVSIERSDCISCGLCVSTCPDVFRIAEDGLAEVYRQPGPARTQVGVVIRPEKQIKNTIFLCCYAKKSAHIALYPPFSSLWPNPFVYCLKKERRHRSVSPRAV